MQALSGNTLFLQFVAIVGLVLIDLAAAVGKALQSGTFEWGRLLEFLRSSVAAYTVIWGVLAGVAVMASVLGVVDGTLTTIVAFVNVVYALIVARIGASILSKFRDMGISKDE